MDDVRFQRRLESPKSPNNLVIPAKAGTLKTYHLTDPKSLSELLISNTIRVFKYKSKLDLPEPD
jgi:hypothetical protein